ncbi:hypothetical protein E2562_033219 [Oryza meyeriana var. granulata]|uniref:Uncharacterized protein n=1 Tax=Oryza meyeriana var. granulata TaxID=110450 RepID=A0A6G1BPC8_9ORYZ|nr:hypothetical protein E2562_033219 [Oryza meyeriana var. granulata]
MIEAATDKLRASTTREDQAAHQAPDPTPAAKETMSKPQEAATDKPRATKPTSLKFRIKLFKPQEPTPKLQEEATTAKLKDKNHGEEKKVHGGGTKFVISNLHVLEAKEMAMMAISGDMSIFQEMRQKLVGGGLLGLGHCLLGGWGWVWGLVSSLVFSCGAGARLVSGSLDHATDQSHIRRWKVADDENSERCSWPRLIQHRIKAVGARNAYDPPRLQLIVWGLMQRLWHPFVQNLQRDMVFLCYLQVLVSRHG